MPARRSALAIDAGFAMEWFERSLGSGLIDSDTVGARYSSTQFLPLVERILSEARNSNDAWANELESSIRALVTEETPAGTEVTSRVFCNGQGCLIYLEPQGETSFDDSQVMDRLLKEPAIGALASTRFMSIARPSFPPSSTAGVFSSSTARAKAIVLHASNATITAIRDLGIQ